MENYERFNLSCLMRADGDQKLADYLFDCSFYDYHYRIAIHNKRVEELKKLNKTPQSNA